MNRVLKVCILFYVILVFISCDPSMTAEDFFDFDEPYIKSVSPKDGSRGIDPYHEICIKFSENINIKTTEGGVITLTSASGGSNEWNTRWDGEDTVYYTPIYGWTIGEKYTLSIERTVEDKNRNMMKRKFISTFYIGTDFANPYVLDVTNNPYVQENSVEILIYFSKPMNVNATINAISIEPSFGDHRIDFPDISGYEANSVLRIIADEDLVSMSEYTLTIASTGETKALSETGLSMLRDYVYQFAMYADTERPEIINIYKGSFDIEYYWLVYDETYGFFQKE